MERADSGKKLFPEEEDDFLWKMFRGISAVKVKFKKECATGKGPYMPMLGFSKLEWKIWSP